MALFRIDGLCDRLTTPQCRVCVCVRGGKSPLAKAFGPKFAIAPTLEWAPGLSVLVYDPAAGRLQPQWTPTTLVTKKKDVVSILDKGKVKTRPLKEVRLVGAPDTLNLPAAATPKGILQAREVAPIVLGGGAVTTSLKLPDKKGVDTPAVSVDGPLPAPEVEVKKPDEQPQSQPRLGYRSPPKSGQGGVVLVGLMPPSTLSRRRWSFSTPGK